MIEIAFVGDIMLSRGVGEYLSENYSQSILSEPVKEVLADADLCIGNLESPVALNAIPNKKGSFKAHPESLKQVNEFDIFSLANNHIKDCGTEGAVETTKFLKKNLFEFCGLSSNQRMPITPLIKPVKEEKIAFFACAVPDCIKNEKDNNYPKVTDATSKKLLEAIKNQRDIVNYTIVLVHGGNEMIPYPEPSFRDLCQQFIKSGANIVITSHPHVLGGYEKYKSGYIFYSLGDFIFDADSYLRRESAILKLKLNDNINWEYIPTMISNNFEVILADKKLKEQIIDKIKLVTTQLKSFDYDKKYFGYFQSSLRQFQKDRMIYKIKNKGVFHSFRFFIKKIILIPYYAKKIILKQYK